MIDQVSDSDCRSGSRVGFAFTDRFGGVSQGPYATLNLGGHVGDERDRVLENRRLVATELGLDPASVVFMKQVHSPDVAVVDRPWRGEVPAVDAVVTTVPGLALAVLVADCVPVLLADPVAGVVSAVHSGRQGMVSGVVTNAVKRMVELGADPARIHARTGPAACGRCYEVPRQLHDDITGLIPAASSTTRMGTCGLDVPAGVLAQLADLGVHRVELSRTCTMESPDHFSYRRSRVTGRLAGYVWLRP